MVTVFAFLLLVVLMGLVIIASSYFLGAVARKKVLSSPRLSWVQAWRTVVREWESWSAAHQQHEDALRDLANGAPANPPAPRKRKPRKTTTTPIVTETPNE